MKLLDCLDRDVCDWNHVKNRPAVCGDEYHGDAEWRVGGEERGWRLCHRCAQLPKFSRVRVRVKLGGSG